MNTSKLKTFLCLYMLCFVPIFAIVFTGGVLKIPDRFLISLISSLSFTALFYIFGFNKPIQAFFDNKFYAKQDDLNFQKELQREMQRKRALSSIDNENLYTQNQMKIEYIAQIAKIQLQSNQYLANMYQQAVIDNSTKNEISAQKQLAEIEAELKKQGLI